MSDRKKKYRLRRTLAKHRKFSYEVLDYDHIKYAGAAYAKGGFRQFGFEDDLKPKEFRENFIYLVENIYVGGYTLFADTSEGYIPVGMVFMALHSLAVPNVFTASVEWFPWASNRNIIESAVNFYNEVRKEHAVIGYALGDHRKLYEVLAKHGIVRRVGTTYTVFKGDRAAIFETIGL